MTEKNYLCAKDISELLEISYAQANRKLKEVKKYYDFDSSRAPKKGYIPAFMIYEYFYLKK